MTIHRMNSLRPTTACIINHFNYGAFVGDAINSALNQSVTVDEIVVVDDGSEPGHLARVRAACAADTRVQLIEKVNGGQLSCFNAGFVNTTAEIVFFLDADDFWDPTYVSAVLDVYIRRPDISFVAAARRIQFSDGSVQELHGRDRDVGYSIVRCHRHPHWVGGPTSCLSARREVLARFLPFEAGVAWRTCADECLVYGTSLAGARKYELGDVHVNYRVHGLNRWYGKVASASEVLGRRVEGARMVEMLRRKLLLAADMASLAPLEYRTVHSPEWRDFRQYAEVIFNSGLGVGSKLGALANLSMTHWFGRKRERHQ